MCEPSPHIRKILDKLHAVRERQRPARAEDEPEDRAAMRLYEEEEGIVLLLAEEPCLRPADAAAKLDVLVGRLRRRVDLQDDRDSVVTYMLAESARDGLRP